MVFDAFGVLFLLILREMYKECNQKGTESKFVFLRQALKFKIVVKLLELLCRLTWGMKTYSFHHMVFGTVG